MAMSQIAMELDQKATELGFESLQQALDAGCTVEYGPTGQSELVEPLVAAHRAWEVEKNKILEGLKSVYNDIDVPMDDKAAVKNAIKFVESCHE